MILKESSLIVYFPIITVYQKHPLKACLCLISFASQSYWWWSAKHFSFTSWGQSVSYTFCSFGLARPTWVDGFWTSLDDNRWTAGGALFSGHPCGALMVPMLNRKSFFSCWRSHTLSGKRAGLLDTDALAKFMFCFRCADRSPFHHVLPFYLFIF